MCLVKNIDGELCVEPEAIDYLKGLKQKVVVVAVVGLYRTGKSYLMNQLAQKRSGERQIYLSLQTGFDIICASKSFLVTLYIVSPTTL